VSKGVSEYIAAQMLLPAALRFFTPTDFANVGAMLIKPHIQ
jgi:hypothetical protein